MIYDVINFILNLTFKKKINFIKLKLSYHLSSILKKPVILGYPYSLAIETTTNCNLSCPECFSGNKLFTRPTGNMQISMYKKIINEVSPYLLYLLLYFQGEPFLHPELFTMITLAKQKRIYTAISTNGHFFSYKNSKNTIESGLDRIIISVDGITPDTYKIYRKGGDLQKVINGIKRLISWKKKQKSKTPYIIIQSLIMQQNQHQKKEIYSFFKQLGVDKVVFKSMQIDQYQEGNPLMPTIEKYSRYKKKKCGSYIIKNQLKNRCWRMWSSAVVTQNGIIIPCCFDKDAKYGFGNFAESSLKDIWKNNEYNKFRTGILRSRKKINICCNCTEGMNRIIIK